MINKNFWNNKKVFLTGHTGFKGSWLAMWLKSMGVNLKGYSLSPEDKINLFEKASIENNMISEIGDIRDYNRLYNSIIDFKPEILIHMAAQPIVRKSYEDTIDTYSTNVMGTINILESARACPSLKSIVIVTSDKCYENKETQNPYKENEPMGGHDPYSSSKGCCELLINSYRRSFFNDNNSSGLASVRAGNVVGGGDWSKDRLIPDILKSFKKNESVIIRNPSAIRPWQHVLDCLSGYLILTEKLYFNNEKFSGAWNFGPNINDCKPVEWIVEKMISVSGKNIDWVLDKKSNPHEANTLILDNNKSKKFLKWKPKWNIEESITKIIEWHKKNLNDENINEMCLSQINDYINT